MNPPLSSDDTLFAPALERPDGRPRIYGRRSQSPSRASAGHCTPPTIDPPQPRLILGHVVMPVP